ncbi:hypothetical protein pipiens_014373 [Culex pipiens pipiens]|uniref:Uncharacterized protein n=1 Tax=Culex pipiens pipiens TaxID=38569 RepID=A0ABD1CV34_CULPP
MLQKNDDRVHLHFLPGLFTAVEHPSIIPVEVAFKPAKRTAGLEQMSRIRSGPVQAEHHKDWIGLVGNEVDSTRVNKVINELKVKSVEELIASGREMPFSGPAPTAAAEEKKEEKKKEVSEPRSMTTWASVSLNKGFPRGRMAAGGCVGVFAPKAAERHCVVQSFRTINYSFL